MVWRGQGRGLLELTCLGTCGFHRMWAFLHVGASEGESAPRHLRIVHPWEPANLLWDAMSLVGECVVGIQMNSKRMNSSYQEVYYLRNFEFHLFQKINSHAGGYLLASHLLISTPSEKSGDSKDAPKTHKIKRSQTPF